MLRVSYTILLLIAGYVVSWTHVKCSTGMGYDISREFLGSRLDQISIHENPRDNYDFLDFLGSGTSGKVFLATLKDDKSKNKFAIKVFDTHTRKGMAHAAREINALEMLRECEGIPQAKGVYSHGSKFYLVQSFIGGGTLEEIDTARISQHEAMRIAKEIFAIYMRIKEREVCHSDISLSNIMYDAEKKTVHLIDFGDAWIMNRSEFHYLDFDQGDECNDEHAVKNALQEWFEMLGMTTSPMTTS